MGSGKVNLDLGDCLSSVQHTVGEGSAYSNHKIHSKNQEEWWKKRDEDNILTRKCSLDFVLSYVIDT